MEQRKIRLVAVIVAVMVIIDALDRAYNHYEFSMCSTIGELVDCFAGLRNVLQDFNRSESMVVEMVFDFLPPFSTRFRLSTNLLMFHLNILVTARWISLER